MIQPEPDAGGPEKSVDEEWKRRVQKEKEKEGGATEAGGESRATPPLPPPSFTLLVSTFATQALVHFGEVPNPATGKKEADLEQAKFTIDLLEMLETKTRGNLSEDENRYLSDILYDLRMRYVAGAGA